MDEILAYRELKRALHYHATMVIAFDIDGATRAALLDAIGQIVQAAIKYCGEAAKSVVRENVQETIDTLLRELDTAKLLDEATTVIAEQQTCPRCGWPDENT